MGFVVQVYTSPDGSVWTSAGDNLRTFFPADATAAGAANVPISTTAVTDTHTHGVAAAHMPQPRDAFASFFWLVCPMNRVF